jgi:alanine racemase
MYNAFIEVDTQSFIQNLKAISACVKRLLQQEQSASYVNVVKICLPVKANAYGYGLVAMAKIAEPYIDYLAVSCLEEGLALRQSGIRKPILVFGAFTQEQIGELISSGLEITIVSMAHAKALSDLCQKLKLSCFAHIKVDTGMNRIGVQANLAMELINFVYTSEYIKLVGVYSHLSSSDKQNDDYTIQQIQQFSQIVRQVKHLDSEIICHLANSGGICYYPDSYFDMVRPGILSYGYFPGSPVRGGVLGQIQACFSLKAQVVFSKIVKNGSAISYNQQYITSASTKIVTIALGYGDGYRRSLSNLGEVLIGGQKFTISGAVCMDMLMVDVGANNEAAINDEVVLIGRQGAGEITLYDVARKCNTITYEVLCGFTERLKRVYI